MEIRPATQKDLRNIYAYNKTIFPLKKIKCEDYINFWIAKHKNAIGNILLLIDDYGKVAGQVFNSSFFYFYQEKVVHTVWGFDLIVNEQYRKSNWGLDLMLYNFTENPNLLATGSGPLALKINKKLGMAWLGEIRKYVGIINPLYFISSYKKKMIAFCKYPVSISTSRHIYYSIRKDNIPCYIRPFNQGLLEIGRDCEFLKWRFFNKLHQYVFYLRDDQKSYLVLRSIILNSFRVMEIVDFRCENSVEAFEEIYKVASRITKKVHLPVLVCGSSLTTLDKVLERHHFKSIGRPRPILGFVNCKDRKKDIENRNFCFVTLADSDGETNWV